MTSLVPSAYRLAAHPLVVLAQEQHKTKGVRAVFGVLLMFALLCGGVWLLLQSSFGPLQAYLISGTAFWGCWFVLSLIWLFGVPGLNLGPIKIPRSTLQYLGPQGGEAEWLPLKGEIARKHPMPANELVAAPKAGDADPNLSSDLSAAQTAAQPDIADYYANKLKVSAEKIAIPGVVKIDKVSVVNRGGIRWIRVTTAAATPLATDSEDTKDLIRRVAQLGPTSVDLYKDPGTQGDMSRVAVPLLFLVFAGHAVLLGLYEVRRRPVPEGAPERERVAAGV